MTKETAKRIRLIYHAAVSLSIVAAGLCLMAACVGIYRTGDHPFSREAVAAAFSPIAIPVYLCLALVVLGFVLELLLPAESKKLLPGKDLSQLLKRQHRKTDLAASEEHLQAAIADQQKGRRLRRRITAVLLTVGAVIFLCYALDSSHFHQTDINTSMIHAMYVLVPCMGLPCCFAIFAAYRNRASMEKELELLKQCKRAEKAEPEAAPAPAKWPGILRNCLLVIGIALLVYGFCTGGTADVLTKAVNICTECIGLG